MLLWPSLFGSSKQPVFLERCEVDVILLEVPPLGLPVGRVPIWFIAGFVIKAIAPELFLYSVEKLATVVRCLPCVVLGGGTMLLLKGALA